MGWLRHFRLFVFHAMPKWRPFGKDAPSGLLRVDDTKQNSADCFWLRMATPVHCHREKQQGFTTLHSAVSHSVNEVRQLVFKRWFAQWLYRTQADACGSRAIERFRRLAYGCWPPLPTYRIACDAGSDDLLGRCAIRFAPCLRHQAKHGWLALATSGRLQSIATERSSRVSLRSTQLFLTVSMRLENISTNDDLLDGSTERRLTLAEVEPSNGLYG